MGKDQLILHDEKLSQMLQETWDSFNSALVGIGKIREGFVEEGIAILNLEDRIKVTQANQWKGDKDIVHSEYFCKGSEVRIWHDLYSIQFNFKYFSLDREMYVIFNLPSRSNLLTSEVPFSGLHIPECL